MSVLSIDYSELNRSISYSKSTSTNLSNYSKAIERKIANKIDALGTGYNHISTANWFANQKIKKLNDKATQYNDFATKLEGFKEKVKTTDEAVSTTFKTLSSSFKKDSGFKSSAVSEFFTNLTVGTFNSTSLGRWIKDLYNKVSDFTTNIKDEIKHWYKYSWGKYACDIGLSVLAITASIVTICTVGAGFFGFCAIVGSVLMIINSINNIVTSGIAIRNNDDPARAAQFGKLDKVSDVLKNWSNNKIVHAFANGLDLVEGFVGIVGVGSSINKVLQKSKNMTALKNLFSGYKGLGSEFLSLNEEVGKNVASPKSVWNGFKTLKNNKAFRDNLITTFKADARSDWFNMQRKFTSLKSELSFSKDVVISLKTGSDFDKAFSKSLIRDFSIDGVKKVGKYTVSEIKDIFKQSDANKKFNGSLSRLGINWSFSEEVTGAIRLGDYVKGVYDKHKLELNFVEAFYDEDMEEIKNIFEIKNQIIDKVGTFGDTLKLTYENLFNESLAMAKQEGRYR